MRVRVYISYALTLHRFELESGSACDFFPLKESTPKALKTPFIVQFLFKRNLNNKVLTAQETPEFAEE